MAEQVEKSDGSKKAEEALERHEAAKEKIKEIEEQDEPPKDLKDWPDDESKYLTYGGAEGDHGYEEGPETKLGPSSLERHEMARSPSRARRSTTPTTTRATRSPAARRTPTPRTCRARRSRRTSG